MKKLKQNTIGAGELALLRESHERLRGKNLLGPDGVVLSLRIPGESAFAVLGADDSSSAGEGDVLDFTAKSLLREGAPNVRSRDRDKIYLPHARIYRLRPDVGAIVYNRPVWGGALALLDEPMPGIFDEQARQMGARVERLQGTSRGEDFDRESRKRLRSGANVFLYEDRVLCLGMTRERAVFNCELLEKCAQAFILARATGERIRRIPWFVRFIANRRLLKDEKRSAEAYARGEVPGGFTAY